MKKMSVNGLTLFYDAKERNAADLIWQACEKSIQLIYENWELATFSMTLVDRISPFYTYDGINSRPGLSIFATEWLTLTGYFLEKKELVLSVGCTMEF